ncbi:MAG: hypothetical protein K0B02_01910 [DPANN group archaeon]|nr:hypothetical protein [DPANN group archaeon]
MLNSSSAWGIGFILAGLYIGISIKDIKNSIVLLLVGISLIIFKNRENIIEVVKKK